MGAGDNGGPCAADADCRSGHCVAEFDETGQPTGWIGGYCLSFGRQAPIAQGLPVPEGNCPPGSGVVPLDGEQEGDLAPCFRVCDVDADCRPGYVCDGLTPSSGVGRFFSNGLCLPVDCHRTGSACPAGYRCASRSTDAAVLPGYCVPDAGDAGTDAGRVDGATDGTGEPDVVDATADDGAE